MSQWCVCVKIGFFVSRGHNLVNQNLFFFVTKNFDSKSHFWGERKQKIILFFSYLLPSRSIAEDSGHQETALLESKIIFQFQCRQKFHNFIISACFTPPWERCCFFPMYKYFLRISWKFSSKILKVIFLLIDKADQ